MVLVRDDEDKYIAKYTEAQRNVIGIGVALAVLVVILIVIYFMVSCYPRYLASLYSLTCTFSEKKKRLNPAFFNICK